MEVVTLKQSKNTSRTLALDQASIQTGYAIFEGINLMKWGLLECSDKDDADVRLPKMMAQIQDLVDTYRPTTIVFEGIQQQKNPRVNILLARLQGCIMEFARIRDIPFEMLQPTAWRSILDFNQGNKVVREELKAQAMKFVKDSYGLDVGEDTCESICIGLAYFKKRGELPDLAAVRRDFKEKQHGKASSKK